MNENCAKHFLMALQREYGKAFSIEGLKQIKPALMRESDNAMEGAYNWIIGNIPKPNLPSPNKLLEIVQIEGKKITMTEAKKNEEEYERQKPRRDAPTFLSQEQKTEYGKRSALIMAMATPRNEQGMPLPVDRERLEKLVEACELMESCYPHVAEDWKDLKMYFIQKDRRASHELREGREVGNRD